ncbi:MAG: HAMP domain-containing sensor histidine kinase [Patescibacteria group bacterium]
MHFYKMKINLTYLKLSSFYVLIIMLISASFSLAIFKISSNELNRGLDRQAGVFRGLPPGSFLTNPFQDMENIRIQQLHESNDKLKLNLLYFNLLILALSSGLSYFWARRTMRPIEEAMESQNRFTADASHELRTPLTAMRTEIEVNLRNGELSSHEAKKLLASNLEEISKLETLSSALLKLANQNGQVNFEFGKVSVEEVIAEAYSKIESLAKKKLIEFENSFQNLFVRGDKAGLTELFIILLDNAIKYSQEKSKIFIIIEEEKDQAIIKIKDQGIGIKASDLPYIFNRFYRADTSRSKNKVDGYGLGLSIAKRIAEMHKGKISVESQVGQGSTFTIEIPLVHN